MLRVLLETGMFIAGVLGFLLDNTIPGKSFLFACLASFLMIGQLSQVDEMCHLLQLCLSGRNVSPISGGLNVSRVSGGQNG